MWLLFLLLFGLSVVFSGVYSVLWYSGRLIPLFHEMVIIEN